MILTDVLTFDLSALPLHPGTVFQTALGFLGEKPPIYYPVILGALLIILIVWRKRFRDRK